MKQQLPMRPAQLFVCCLTIVLQCGCTVVNVRSESELYFRHHPEMRARYPQVDCVSVAVLDDEVNAGYRSKMSLLTSFRDQVKSNTEILSKIARSELVVDAVYKEEKRTLKELREALAEFGGQAFLYEYDSPSIVATNRTIETGYIVVSGGEIRKKVGVVVGRSLP